MTCDPGLERIAMLEIVEEIPEASELRSPLRGRVTAEIPVEKIEKLFKLKSIHSVALLLSQKKVAKSLSGLDEIREAVCESKPWEFLLPNYTFAVEARRIGEGHSYTSIDVARAVGAAFQKCVAEVKSFVPEVRLNSPHVVLYAEINDDVFSFGIELTPERSLHARRYRVYDHPASLKPTIAYGMLRLSKARDGEHIVDPMCGGGTIAIEAALLFESSPVTCIDINREYLRGAMMNALMARVYKRINFIRGDVTQLSSILGSEVVDRLVTNPPYGLRMGDVRRSKELLEKFIPEAWKTLRSGGTLTLVTPYGQYVKKIAFETGFTLLEELEVYHGDLRIFLEVFEKGLEV
ncbi:MAG: THUMP domain-containing protein [Acidilobaceae archaeon]